MPTKHGAVGTSSYIFLLCIILAPISGFIIDKIGHKITCLFISNLILVIAHTLILMPLDDEIFGIISVILIAISYSLLNVCIWASIPLIVSIEMIGFSYGIIFCIQNIFVVISSLILSILQITAYSDYEHIEIFLLVFSVLALIFSLVLHRTDRKIHKSILQDPCRKKPKPTKTTTLRSNASTPLFRTFC